MALNGLDNLACWVQQEREPLLTNLPWGAPTIELLTMRTGIKCREAIGMLGVDVQFQDCGCNNDPAGNVNFSDRLLEIGCIEVFDTICDVDLLCTKYETYVRRMAGQESLMQLEEWLVRSILLDIQNKLEIALWQGDTDSTNPNLNKFDGLIKILNAANPATPPAEPGVPTANRFTQNAGETDYQFLRRIFLSAPILSASQRGNLVAFVGLDRFQSITAQLTDIRINFIENPSIPGGLREPYRSAQEIYMPGTNYRIIGVPGLIGTNQVIIGSLDNMFWGTDYADDRETILFDFNTFHNVWFYRVKFFMGVQVGLVDEIVTGTFTSDLAAPGNFAVGVNILSPLGDNGGVLTEAVAAAAAGAVAPLLQQANANTENLAQVMSSTIVSALAKSGVIPVQADTAEEPTKKTKSKKADTEEDKTENPE